MEILQPIVEICPCNTSTKTRLNTASFDKTSKSGDSGGSGGSLGTKRRIRRR
ncbi:MAG TPA: hypothetical protein VIP70_03050 [Nitrososphaeraceae archaeon]